jgi:hypothetical protein
MIGGELDNSGEGRAQLLQWRAGALGGFLAPSSSFELVCDMTLGRSMLKHGFY